MTGFAPSALAGDLEVATISQASDGVSNGAIGGVAIGCEPWLAWPCITGCAIDKGHDGVRQPKA